MLRKTKNPYRKTLQAWDKKVGKTLSSLQKEMKGKHPQPAKIRKNYQQLVLLVGEWNYLARECQLMEKKLGRKSKNV
jgi:hypothetical protein